MWPKHADPEVPINDWIAAESVRSWVYLLLATKTPWNHVMFSWGLRAGTGKRAMRSIGSKMRYVVPSR